jgi:hypothetical protein
VAANIGPDKPLASGAPIELFFDRLLLPISVTRQSLVLTDLSGNGWGTPVIVYDPVARSATLHPIPPLPPCQNFRVYLATPANNAGLGWLQAIDGAPLDPSTAPFVEFPVSGTCTTGGSPGDGGTEGGTSPEAGSDAATDAGTASDGGDAGDAGTSLPSGAPIDFCGTVLPIFRTACSTESCHGGPSPAVGLRLDTSQGVVDTAIGRVSVESNQGPQSVSEPPSVNFGLDLPIVDTTGGQGSPGTSWMIYKLMLATPLSPTPTVNLHSEPWSDIGATERATLGNYVTGSEMPFPMTPGTPSASAFDPLTLDEIEQISFWIQQGAGVPPCAE